MSRLSRSLIATFVAAGTLGLSACGGSNPPDPESPTAAVTVATAAAVDHTSAFAAVERGTFIENQLNAQVKTYPSGVEITNAVVAGEAQFGMLGSYALLTAASAGLPVKIVAIAHGDASSTSYNANQAIIAGPKSGIAAGNVAGLKGKKIGLPQGASPEAFVTSVLKGSGLRVGDVKIVNVLPPDAITALQQGSVDAIAVFEPAAQNALTKVAGSVLVTEGGAEGWFDPGVIIANEKYLASNPEQVKNFLASIAQSQQWIRKNRQEAATIATHFIDGLDPKIAEAALEHVTLDPRISKKTLEAYASSTVPFLVAQKKVPADFDASTTVAPTILTGLVEKHPDWFADLPPVDDADLAP